MAQVTALSPIGTPGPPYSFSAKPAPSSSLNLRISLGSVVLVASGAVVVPTTGSNVPWEIEGEFVVRTIGASGTTTATGDHDNGQTSGLLANSGTLTIDTTSSADITVSAQWSTASASNTITVQNLEMERAG